MSDKTINFIIALARNIKEIKIYSGEFADIKKIAGEKIYYKKHPLFTHYEGIAETYDTIFQTKGYYRSFSAFWKQCEKEMKTW
jgi:hypothetical protein